MKLCIELFICSFVGWNRKKNNNQVVHGTTYARFRAERNDQTGETVTASSAGVTTMPGRSFKFYPMGPSTRLRKWFDATFGH